MNSGVANYYMIMRGLTLANSGGQVGKLSMQHAHPHVLHPKISLCTINVLIWLVCLHMVSHSGVPWKNCVHTGAPTTTSVATKWSEVTSKFQKRELNGLQSQVKFTSKRSNQLPCVACECTPHGLGDFSEESNDPSMSSGPFLKFGIRNRTWMATVN